jgi:hypothetical protein
MPFELPETFAPRDKPLLLSSKQIYTRRLNSLSKLGLGNTPDDLKKNHKKIIEYLNTLHPTTELGKQKIRGILTAIFWVMTDKYRHSNNAYYKFYQTVLPGSVKGSDKAWVTKKEYVSDSD